MIFKVLKTCVLVRAFQAFQKSVMCVLYADFHRTRQHCLGVGGTSSGTYRINMSNGALLNYFDVDSLETQYPVGQSASIEPRFDSDNNFAGFAIAGHNADSSMSDQGLSEYASPGAEDVAAYTGRLSLFDASGNLIKMTRFHNFEGGKYAYTGFKPFYPAMIRTECWGLDSMYDSEGKHTGYVVGCGQGVEPDICANSKFKQAARAKCNQEQRQAWRSVTLRFNLNGDMQWYRMDNFVSDPNEIGSSANEWVMARGDEIVSLTDEGFGFTFEKYTDTVGKSGVSTTSASTTSTQGDTATTTSAQTTTTITTATTTTANGINCCGEDPCPGDTEACWISFENACGEFENLNCP